MASLARADLEALLRSRQLDRTLTSALPVPAPGGAHDALPTGIAPLDRLLGGGVPRGALSEVTGARSSGRTSVLQAMLASAINAGELVALIDPLDMFDPPSAAAAGIDTRRLLWIRGEPWQAGPAAAAYVAPQAGSRAAGPATRALAVVERGVKSLNLVLQAGGFGLAVLDLAEVPAAVIRQLPWTTWLRLQRVVEGTSIACVVVGPAPMARSAGGVTMALQAARRGVWTEGAARLLLGLEFDVRVIRARAATAVACRVRAAACGGSWAQPHGEPVASARVPVAAFPAAVQDARARHAARSR